MRTSLDPSDYYFNASLQALQNGDAYVAPGTPGVTIDQVRKDIGSSDVAVVVLPKEASAYGTPAIYAAKLVQWTNHDTVIVIIDGDMEAASRTIAQSELGGIVTAAEVNNSNLDAAITQAIGGIQQAETSTSVGQPTPVEDGGTSILGISSILLVVALVGGGVGAWMHRRKRLKAQATEQATAINTPDPLASIHVRIDTLEGQSQRILDVDMRFALNQALADIEKVLQRNNDEAFIAEVESMLDRVIDVVKEYLYFQDNPREFQDSLNQLLSRGKLAVKGFAAEALATLQTGNGDRLIRFLAATELLGEDKLKLRK